MIELRDISEYLDSRIVDVYNNANEFSDQLITRATEYINRFLSNNGINAQHICFVAVGSVGRKEALAASDLDLIPICDNAGVFQQYGKLDTSLRSQLKDHLRLKVSEGSHLTRLSMLDEIASDKCIGGMDDSSSCLTKRILILTEGVCVGGALDLKKIRSEILNAYQKYSITSGRYILTLCNDLARYYRTLCIEYIAKINVEEKDWCTRNVKLRFSRKLWYFSNMLTTAALACEKTQEQKDYNTKLIEYFSVPPYLRFFSMLSSKQIPLGRGILEAYANYLDFMSKAENREVLSVIKHSDRYCLINGNPFPMLKANSDLLHNGFIQIIETMNFKTRQKILDWYFL